MHCTGLLMPMVLDLLLGRKRYPVLDPRDFDDPVAVQTG